MDLFKFFQGALIGAILLVVGWVAFPVWARTTISPGEQCLDHDGCVCSVGVCINRDPGNCSYGEAYQRYGEFCPAPDECRIDSDCGPGPDKPCPPRYICRVGWSSCAGGETQDGTCTLRQRPGICCYRPPQPPWWPIPTPIPPHEPTPIPSRWPTPTPRPSLIPTLTPTPTLTPCPTVTPTPTLTPAPTPTATGTPTLTPTPTLLPSLTPTPAPEPTATPIPLPPGEPICTGLSATPVSGFVPLGVTFTGSGSRWDGEIHAFEFNFGDGSPVRRLEENVGGTGSASVVHTYQEAGSYWASVRVMDNDGIWSSIPENCKVKITVEGKVLGVKVPEEAPKAGFSVLGLSLLGILGIMMRVILL